MIAHNGLRFLAVQLQNVETLLNPSGCFNVTTKVETFQSTFAVNVFRISETETKELRKTWFLQIKKRSKALDLGRI